MRLSTWLGAVVLSVALWAPSAHAQYANRSLGGGAGFIGLSGSDQSAGLGYTIPLNLEGHLYIENGFDLFLHVPLMLVYTKLGAPTTTGQGLVFGTGGELGVRYLFLEENIRPWAGIYLAGLVVLRDPTTVLVGPGGALGLEYFVNDSTSIGVRAFFNLYLELNAAPTFGTGGAASVAFYF